MQTRYVSKDTSEYFYGSSCFGWANLGHVLVVFSEMGVAFVAQDILGMPETVLQRNNVYAQFGAVINDVFDFRFLECVGV